MTNFWLKYISDFQKNYGISKFFNKGTLQMLHFWRSFRAGRRSDYRVQLPMSSNSWKCAQRIQWSVFFEKFGFSNIILNYFQAQFLPMAKLGQAKRTQWAAERAKRTGSPRTRLRTSLATSQNVGRKKGAEIT